MFAKIRIVALFSLAFIVGTQAGASESAPFTVGVILPLTGPSAFIGATCKAAVELAVSDIPEAERGRLRVIFEDDGLVPARSVTVGRKLLDVDHVDGLLTWSSSTGLSLASITERKRIPHLSIASDPAVAVGRDYTFTYWALPQDEARALYEYLVSSGMKRIAILAVTHNGILALRDALVSEARRDGRVQVVTNEEVAPDMQDFRGILERIKSRGEIDALVPIFFPGQLAISVKQARGVGIKAPVVGFETFEDKDEIEAAQGLFDGVVFSTGADPSPEFTRAFQGRNPGSTMYTASNCYDVVRLLFDASREGRDGNTIAKYLRGLRNYRAVSGTISATGDNRFSLPTTLKTIDGHGAVLPLARGG